MTRPTTEVNKAALSQQNNPLAVREDYVIDLRLNVLPFELTQIGDVNFIIEVAYISDNGLVLHALHLRS